MAFFGICKGMLESGFPNVAVEDMYSEHFARFYENCVTENDDVKWYKAIADQFGKKILDLGCGTGRETIPLLQAGYDVTAVDLSDDMLNILAKKAEGYHLNNLKVVKADMCEVRLPEKQDVVILPISTILIIEDKEKLFRNVYENLRPGGVFAFWYTDYTKVGKSQTMKPIYMFSKGKHEFCMLMERLNFEEGISDANLYLEEANDEGTNRYIAASRKYLFTDEYMNKLIQSTGFREISNTVVESENCDMVYKLLLKEVI